METVYASQLVQSIPRMHAHVIIADSRQCYFVKSPIPGYCEARAAMGLMIAALCGVKTVEPTKVVFANDFVARFANSSEVQRFGSADPINEGTFFGTRYPADPSCSAIFDLIPIRFAGQIRNIVDFSTMRSVDCWIANASPGRAIFVRQPEKDLIAYMLGFGNSFSFGEANKFPNFNWKFAPLFTDDAWRVAMTTVDLIRKITKSDLESIVADIPIEWWRRNQSSAAEIIAILLQRQSGLDQLLAKLYRTELGLPMRKLAHIETALASALSGSGTGDAPKQWLRVG